MGTTTEAKRFNQPVPTARVFPSPKIPEGDPIPGSNCNRRREKAPRGAWRQLVLCRADWIRHEAEQAQRKGSSVRARHIFELVDKARRVAHKPGGLITWFEGCQQERAWLTLHDAEAELIELLTGEELCAHARDIARKAHRLLGPQDQRMQCVAMALDDCTVVPDERLAIRVAHLARATFEVMDDRYAQSRGFRNRLIRASALALLGVVGLVVATSVSNLHLRPGPNVPTDIPAGWETSLLVALFGAVGALVSAVPPLAKAQGTRNPFSLPVFQCMLKLVMGPLFAFVGLLLIQTEVIDGFQPLGSLMQLVVWAALFGAGQQTVTRVIDQRLKGMLTVASDPEPAPKRQNRGDGRLHTGPLPTTQASAANGHSGGEAQDPHVS